MQFHSVTICFNKSWCVCWALVPGTVLSAWSTVAGLTLTAPGWWFPKRVLRTFSGSWTKSLCGALRVGRRYRGARRRLLFPCWDLTAGTEQSPGNWASGRCGAGGNAELSPSPWSFLPHAVMKINPVPENILDEVAKLINFTKSWLWCLPFYSALKMRVTPPLCCRVPRVATTSCEVLALWAARLLFPRHPFEPEVAIHRHTWLSELGIWWHFLEND